MEQHLKHSSPRTGAIAALLAAVSLAGGCGGGGGGTEVSTPASTPPTPTSAELPPAVAQAQSSQTAVSPSLAAADNTLGLDLFKILDQGSTANVAISPTSIALVLQILYNGAAGSTQQAMSQALQLEGLTVADVNSDNAALQAALVNPDPEIALTVANSLWMHLSSNSVLPSFTQVNETYYGAELGDLAGAPANVNTWISNETDGLITTILPAGSYSSDVAVVVNALYFKGAWTQPFDPNQTSTAPFIQLDGTSVSCPMMHLTGMFNYFTGATFQAVRLPYGTNSRMSMVILLPNSGVSLAALVGSITPQALDGWISELQPMTGSVALPRFTATYGASLPGALSALGMGIAFSPNGADFSGIAPGIYLSDVEHKTVVEVDESGTVAAAATSGSTTITAAPTPQFQITMDRPFFYAIRDDETGALLFIGTMVAPGQ
jgi:serpin B